MRSYQITELEHLTGIKAHTIRIWEKRYKLIEPDRTSTNYRRYNDEQVKKLLNVSTLLSNGYKISKIAALSEKELHGEILESQSSISIDAICIVFINNMLKAMISFDESAFEKNYNTVIDKFGLFDGMIKVFDPLLKKIDMLWAIDDVSTAQEHFALHLIKRKLMVATDLLPLSKNKKKKFLLLLVPGEMHDMSLLFANYVIRSKGYETIYLGQDVPYENISLVIKQTKPNYILTFFTLAQDAKDVYNDLKNNIHLNESTRLLVSGNTAITDLLKNKLSAEIIYQSTDLLKYLQ